MQIRSIATFVVLAFAAGCVHTPRGTLRSEVGHFGARLPPCAIDVQASEVWIGVRWFGNMSLPYEGDAIAWREAIAETVGRACDAPRDGQISEPGRFRIYVDADVSDGSFIAVATPLQIIAAILFIPIGSAKADVVLEYEYKGTVYKGFAHGHALQGLFYNFEASGPSFGEALKAAIEDIARQMAS